MHHFSLSPVWLHFLPKLRHVQTLNVSLFLLWLQSPSANPWKDPALDKLSLFCEESRSVYDWVPSITLPERWSMFPTMTLHYDEDDWKKVKELSFTRGCWAFLKPHTSGLKRLWLQPPCTTLAAFWVSKLVLDYPPRGRGPSSEVWTGDMGCRWSLAKSSDGHWERFFSWGLHCNSAREDEKFWPSYCPESEAAGCCTERVTEMETVQEMDRGKWQGWAEQGRCWSTWWYLKMSKWTFLIQCSHQEVLGLSRDFACKSWFELCLQKWH